MEFQTKVTSQGFIYLPKEVKTIITGDVRIVPDGKAILVYSSETSLESVIESIEIIKLTLQHKLRMERKNRD